MEICVVFILLFLGKLAAAQSQDGFISLDCGLNPQDSPYKEPQTELNFTSDAAFVNAGQRQQIKPEYKSKYLGYMTSLRSFPQGKRNCYNFNVTTGTRYLIRVVSLYGNYDDQNVLPSFDLHIGPNKWTTITTTGVDGYAEADLIHVVTSDRLQVCLVKNGRTTPIVSTIGLRPLDSESYSTRSGSLHKLLRWYLANYTTSPIRFNEDVHDRVWIQYFRDDWMQLNTTLDVPNNNTYTVPQLALATAATPKNASEPLSITWTSGNATTQFYMYLHIAEIETLEANETREFDIFLNGEVWVKTPITVTRAVDTIYTIRPTTCPNGRCTLELIRTARSTRPPLLNAIEVYTVVEFPLPETERNDVEAVKRMNDAYNMNQVDWQGDSCNPPELVWDGLSCSYNNGTKPPRITSLNLSSRKLMGTIAPSTQNLTELQELDLSNNSLIGKVPEFLAHMKSLSLINLSGNNLNGSIPQALLDREKEGSLKLIDKGNPNLRCPSGACKNQDVRKKPKTNHYLIAIAFLVAIIVLLPLSFIISSKIRSRKINRAKSTPNTNKNRRFTYSEVLKMTNNFEKILGQGGFGIVYEGRLDETEPVAVKVMSKPSDHAYKQFRAEVEILVRVHHRNLVRLVGYCDEGDKFALVYEFMAKGDLNEHLSGKRDSGLLSWGSRLKILTEAAHGLEYLHNGCKPPIIHRDVKTANILLDGNFQARLADFGLSRAFSVENESQTPTTIGGTPGYIDPECHQTNRLTEKSDVYSFGVVILAMLTNRPVIDNTRANCHIVEWVGFMVRLGNIREIVDEYLQNVTMDMNSLWAAVDLGLECARSSSDLRPTMGQVVVALDNLLAAENANAGSRTDSESMRPVVNDEFTPAAR